MHVRKRPADLAAFLTAQDGVWYFTDLETEPGSFAEQVHNVCRDGELPFATDADVYRKGLEKAAPTCPGSL